MDSGVPRGQERHYYRYDVALTLTLATSSVNSASNKMGRVARMRCRIDDNYRTWMP